MAMSLNDDIMRFVSPNRQCYVEDRAGLKEFLKSSKEFQFKNGQFYVSSPSSSGLSKSKDNFLYLFASNQLLQFKLTQLSDGNGLKITKDYGWQVEQLACSSVESIESFKKYLDLTF